MVQPVLHVGAHAFLSALDAGQRQCLHVAAGPARQPVPQGLVAWWCDANRMGLLPVARAQWLASQLPGCALLPQGLVWRTEGLARAPLSQALQGVLEQAHRQGLLHGWRNERFSFWHSDCEAPNVHVPALLDVERSGFRFLGMLSHAVHVNGFTPDGHLWIARRALSKATDPGMLDNLTAGGLPSGETVHDCLVRELAEEAGLQTLQGQVVQAAGHVRTSRLEAEGWHDEVLHVFNLTLSPDFVPRNQDGEVAEFMCLAPHAVLQRLSNAELTPDAAHSLLHGLRAFATA